MCISLLIEPCCYKKQNILTKALLLSVYHFPENKKQKQSSGGVLQKVLQNFENQIFCEFYLKTSVSSFLIKLQASSFLVNFAKFLITPPVLLLKKMNVFVFTVVVVVVFELQGTAEGLKSKPTLPKTLKVLLSK